MIFQLLAHVDLPANEIFHHGPTLEAHKWKQQALSSFSQTSKDMRALAEPWLYRVLIRSRDESPRSKKSGSRLTEAPGSQDKDPFRLCIRTIRQRPELAAALRSLIIHRWVNVPQRHVRRIRDHCGKVERLIHVRGLSPLERLVGVGIMTEPDAVDDLQFLTISILGHRLEELELIWNSRKNRVRPSDLREGAEGFRNLLMKMKVEGVNAFPSLRRLSIRPSATDGSRPEGEYTTPHLRGREDGKVNGYFLSLEVLDYLEQIPSLRELVINCLYSGPTNLPATKALPLSLVELTLDHCNLPCNVLQQVMERMVVLRKLRLGYDHGPRYRRSDETQYWSEVLQSLEPVKEVLEELYVDRNPKSNPMSEPREGGRWYSFEQWPRLRLLQLPEAAICLVEGKLGFVERLPPSVREVTTSLYYEYLGLSVGYPKWHRFTSKSFSVTYRLGCPVVSKNVVQ